MKFANFFLPTYFPDSDGDMGDYFRFVVDFAASSEDLGFDAVWANEHHFSPYGGLMASVPVFLAALSQRTSRIRLGTSVVVLPFHNPIEVAEQLAMVDLMCDGRLEFGFGRGYIPDDYRGFGVSPAEGQDRTMEGLEVVLKAWSGKPFSHEGKHWAFHDLAVWPKPQQEPHPPVWMACSQTPASFEWAARSGYPLLTIAHLNPIEMLAERTALYRETWAAAGHDPAACRIASHFNIYVDEDGGRAREVCIRATDRSLKQSAPGLPEGHTQAVETGGTRLLNQRRVIGGNPDEVVGMLGGLQDELGFTAFHGKFIFGGIPRADAERSLRLFAEHVIPRLRDREPKTLAAASR